MTDKAEPKHPYNREELRRVVVGELHRVAPDKGAMDEAASLLMNVVQYELELIGFDTTKPSDLVLQVQRLELAKTSGGKPLMLRVEYRDQKWNVHWWDGGDVVGDPVRLFLEYKPTPAPHFMGQKDLDGAAQLAGTLVQAFGKVPYV